MIVTATGADTELGKISGMLSATVAFTASLGPLLLTVTV